MATKIAVDAGHGGSNPGATYQGRRESDDALRLAMAVGRILEENGYDVIYTRTSDVSQSVGQKAAIANEEGADLFVSIHRNAAEYPGKYNGIQTLIYDDSGIKKEIAENINANLERLGFRNAGVSIRPNLVVLNSTQMPALLVEAGFIDSDKDNQLFDSGFHNFLTAHLIFHFLNMLLSICVRSILARTYRTWYSLPSASGCPEGYGLSLNPDGSCARQRCLYYR